MVKWKLCLGTGLLAACCFSAGAFAAGHVEDVEAISQVYGDGEKLAEVQLRYDTDLLGSSVTAEDYAVPGRTVAKAFVSAVPYGKAAEKGRYVQVELEPLPLSDQMVDPHPEDKHKAPVGVGGPSWGAMVIPSLWFLLRPRSARRVWSRRQRDGCTEENRK